MESFEISPVSESRQTNNFDMDFEEDLEEEKPLLLSCEEPLLNECAKPKAKLFYHLDDDENPNSAQMEKQTNLETEPIQDLHLHNLAKRSSLCTFIANIDALDR
jgi:hypothetical protein